VSEPGWYEEARREDDYRREREVAEEMAEQRLRTALEEIVACRYYTGGIAEAALDGISPSSEAQKVDKPDEVSE
jgi:pyruvoyl-dependent arginine decarboxylase (PvlArgDC)